MEEKITVTLLMADRTKKAQVTLPENTTIAALIEACKKNWALPQTEDYAIRDPQRNRQLNTRALLRFKPRITTRSILNGSKPDLFAGRAWDGVGCP